MRGVTAALLIAIAAMGGGTAAAQTVPEATDVDSADPFADLTPLPAETLSERRGGMNIGGYAVEFGVVVTAGGQLVSTLATDLAALRDALAEAGQDPSVYVDTEGGVSLEGLTTVVVNTQDDVRLEHFVRIDVVIDDGIGGTLNAGRDALSLIGLPDTLPSF